MPEGVNVLAWGVVAVLAGNGLVEVWHHSELFAGPRARHEAGHRFVDRLLSCPFCLSVWCGWAAVLALAAPWWLGTLLGRPGELAGAVPRLLACGLAAARGANLLNDWCWGWQRTPGRKERT